MVFFFFFFLFFFLVRCCSSCLEVWWPLFALGCIWEDSVMVWDENTIEFYFFKKLDGSVGFDTKCCELG